MLKTMFSLWLECYVYRLQCIWDCTVLLCSYWLFIRRSSSLVVAAVTLHDFVTLPVFIQRLRFTKSVCGYIPLRDPRWLILAHDKIIFRFNVNGCERNAMFKVFISICIPFVRYSEITRLHTVQERYAYKCSSTLSMWFLTRQQSLGANSEHPVTSLVV